jgi:hypothetical protein
LFREIAAHHPGVFTKVGLGTFVDPRLGGGRINSQTTVDLVRVHELDGEDLNVARKMYSSLYEPHKIRLTRDQVSPRACRSSSL